MAPRNTASNYDATTSLRGGGAIDLSELSSYYGGRTRPIFTTVRRDDLPEDHTGREPNDLLSLVSVICQLYNENKSDLVAVKSFHHGAELSESSGANLVVSRKAMTTYSPSNLNRGTTESSEQDFIIKRTREAIIAPGSKALRSFLTEVRIRAHPPLRMHANIVDLCGIGWDFEDVDRLKPRPLWLEEYASEGSLARFWGRQNLTRMPFKLKCSLALDIGNALSALHACGVVHGDVKPDNILIFPKRYPEGGYLAKLTDFGHSVLEYENRSDLPAFTVPYSAPEATRRPLSFYEMKQTDVYSYGLVLLSLFLGRNACQDFGDQLQIYKTNDTLDVEALKLIEREDHEQTDSDFDLPTLKWLFMFTLSLRPASRQLDKCLRHLRRYQVFHQSGPGHRMIDANDGIAFASLEPQTNKLFIGYQTLSQCSFLLKQHIFQSLLDLSASASDDRKEASLWELCVCYFSGFGVDRNYALASDYLVKAADAGVLGAQAYFMRLIHAMGYDPYVILVEHGYKKQEQAHQQIITWLILAIDTGYAEVLTDLQQLDGDNGQHYLRSKARIAHEHSKIVPFQQHEEQLLLGMLEEADADIGDSAAVAEQLIEAAAAGDIELVKSFLHDDPKLINVRDKTGSTALVRAARASQIQMVKFLLGEPGVDPSINNCRLQNVLHFLPNFTDSEIGSILPKLLDRGADIDQEGAFVEHGWGNTPDLKPQLSGCPLLQAVLNNRAVLLRALLRELHRAGPTQQVCRVCQSGSRFRKLMATAIMMRHVAIVETLQEHRTAYGTGHITDIRRIEVWHNYELIQAWELTIRGMSAGLLNLPESFCRALVHGRASPNALQRTLQLFWQEDRDYLSKHAYTQLRQAVVANNIDAVECILLEVRRFALLDQEWWFHSMCWDSAISLAIRLGFRDIFCCLSGRLPGMLYTSREYQCVGQSCPMRCYTPSFLPEYWKKLWTKLRKKKHRFNPVQIALSFAVVAPHQDDYFVRKILEQAPADLVLREVDEYDELISHQPTSFLAQAVLVNAGWAVHLILQRYPQCIQQSICIIPAHCRPQRPDEFVSPVRPSILDMYNKHDARLIQLRQHILLVGSYAQCQLLFKHISAHALPRPPKGRAIRQVFQRCRSTPAAVSSTIWDVYDLDSKEYHTLLCGLVRDDRPERQSLWELVSNCVLKGHPRRSVYLRMALLCANPGAVKQLLNRGWPVENLYWSWRETALDLALSITAKEVPAARASQFQIAGIPKSPRSQLDDASIASIQRSLKENIDILQQSGATVSWSKKYSMIMWGVHPLIYLFAIPMAIARLGQMECSKGQPLPSTSFLWVYGSCIFAMVFPPMPVLLQAPLAWRASFGQPWYSCICQFLLIPMLWLFNNVVVMTCLLRYRLYCEDPILLCMGFFWITAQLVYIVFFSAGVNITDEDQW